MTKKKNKPKKILKIIGGVIIFITLPTLLLFAFMYFKYNEDLPTGEQGPAADQLATRMLNTLNHDAYKATDYIEFTFKKRHHYKWNKTENTCEVYWKNVKVDIDLADHSKSHVYFSEEKYEGKEKQDYIQKAVDYFNNDTFWLVAPYKVFDEGVERRLVKTEDNENALLITYTNGGSTPGDSYLWHFDENGKPKSYQMWVDILPINGLEASWSDWTTTDTGAELPTFHKLLAFGLEIEGLKTNNKKQELKDDDITSLDITHHPQGLHIPVTSYCHYIDKIDVPEEDIYFIDRYGLFFKHISEKSFLNKTKSLINSLETSDDTLNKIDGRISVLVHYKAKKTDSICFSESFGSITLNGLRMKDSERFQNLIKQEIKFENSHRTLNEVLGLVETIN